jgi:DNA ligase D-like protein (predicted 3'-phosphoesterase)
LAGSETTAASGSLCLRQLRPEGAANGAEGMLLATIEGMATKRSGPRSGTKRSTAKKPSVRTAKRSTAKRSTRSSASKAGSAKAASTKAGSTKTSAAKASTAKRGTRAGADTGSTGGRTRTSAPLAEYNAKRDFTRTAEPAGSVPKARGKALQFVIQKHAASHLHYDFRLELDGVMKSWAVPKGPSLDPTVRRLAMEVEDHPISYNTFEGTIPKGEYGGGTVMLWDRGTYEADDGGGAESLRRGYEKGELRFVMHGKRLKGGFVLARLRRPGRPQWLLIKRRDAHATADRDITAEVTTSVVSRRTMDQIAAGRRVWHSNR